MELQILDTDRLFDDSPNAGTPACICSRCGAPITEEQAPVIRVFVGNDGGEINAEYRYHMECLCPPSGEGQDIDEVTYEDLTIDEDNPPSICGFACLVCHHTQDHPFDCDYCNSQELDPIYF